MSSCVAIIDDSEVILGWTKGILEKEGFRVETYMTPFGAQAFIESTRPDLVLLDVRMPGLRGDTLCKLLKRDAGSRKMVVALFSSLDASELAGRARACKADGYITKTNDADELIAQVRALLR